MAAKKSLLSDEEKAAMKEMKAERSKGKANGEDDVRAAIAKMPQPDRGLAEKIHDLVKVNAPGLSAKTWYGMPAYANADGKVVVFFQNASKFKARYATLGFNDAAALDDGDFWPTSFAVGKIGSAEEKKIAGLIKKAAG